MGDTNGWGSTSGSNADDWGSGGGGWGDEGTGSGGGGWGDSADKSSGEAGWSSGSKTGNGWGGGGSGGGGAGGGAGGRACYNCNQYGHMSRDCPEPKKERGPGRSCYNCGESGHMSRDCPAPKKERGPGRSCYNCGDSGHMSRECPAPRKERGSGGGSFKSSGGGWGDDGAGKIQSSSSGGWGDEGSGKTQSSSGGGWGDDGAGKIQSSSSGGWGDEDTGKTRSSSGGGWGGDTDNKSNGNRWGDGAKSDNKSGWGAESNNSPRKRFRPDDQDEERPAPYKPEAIDVEEEAKLQIEGAGDNAEFYQEQKVTVFPPNVIEPIEKFEDCITSDVLLANVRSQKYTGLTPIQKWAMPAIFGGHDLIGCAQTGSGKTAAFLLPILQNLLKTELDPVDPNSDCQNPYCLIISPTRELANQIHVHANILSKDSIIKCHVIYGQVSTALLKSRLSTGCHILVATPGRLKDFVERGWIKFKNIKYVVLDEGDRLLDDGFKSDMKHFFEDPSMPSKENRQTLCFSATFKEETQLTAREHLREDFIFLTVGRIGAANESIKQEFLKVERTEKKRRLKKILDTIPEEDKTIVFTQTKSGADFLASFFTTLNLSATSIHGDRHQSQREQAIKAFRRGEKRFLISSPVGNRGLDLPKVALVVNYDLPSNIDEYVHRIGRTGRAGRSGRAISFYDPEKDAEILPSLIEILRGAKQEIPDWMDSGESATNGGETEVQGIGMTESAPEAPAVDLDDGWN